MHLTRCLLSVQVVYLHGSKRFYPCRCTTCTDRIVSIGAKYTTCTDRNDSIGAKYTTCTDRNDSIRADVQLARIETILSVQNIQLAWIESFLSVQNRQLNDTATTEIVPLSLFDGYPLFYRCKIYNLHG